jgi:hypothetical protein
MVRNESAITVGFNTEFFNTICQERTSSRPVGMSENVRALRHQMIPFHKMQFSCTGRNPL